MSGHVVHERCLNCAAPLMGKYCAACGQKDQSDHPELHHFIHEVVHEFVHVDGKTIHSLKMLLLSPGTMTLEYWAGRRVAQIPPLRLYLVASIIMFGLISILPNAKRIPFEPTMRVTSDDYDHGTPHSILDLPVEKRKEIVSGSFDGNSFLKEPLLKAVEDPTEFRHRLLGNASKTMFLMLPLFALVVQIVFRSAKRVYLEQVILALHIHSLAFVLFAAAALMSSEGHSFLRYVSDLLLLLGIPIYGLLTFKKVFGFSWFSTVIRSAVVVFAYSIIFVVTEIGLVAATLSSL